ncbi:putative AIM2 family protein [Smittium mucronatum]|uniref:Putative AIM2 family protein n=1 Tax=Smittium mucronatum TaxID=133383 RepID=A0A1R0GY10_9FUNG|nr:putative AIM2 family protein [Smittium mucronatum]
MESENVTLASACCNRPPAVIEYTPKGEMFHLKNGLRCYITGSKDSKAAIIHSYDIFNYHPNAFHAADIFADAGFRVIMPDMFRDHPVRMEMMGDRQKIMDRLNAVGTFDNLYDDYKAVKEYLVKDEGFDKLLLAGHCWGSCMSMRFSAHDADFLGAALFHPSLVNSADFYNIQCPVILQPSMEDPDWSVEYKAITEKPFGKLCYYQRFDDMYHGWTSGRGEWYDPYIKKRADEAFANAIRGFNRILDARS